VGGEEMSVKQLDIKGLINQFNEKGYLVIPSVLSQEKVARLNSVIDTIISNEPESLAYNIYNSVELHPEIASLIDEPTILPLIVN